MFVDVTTTLNTFVGWSRWRLLSSRRLAFTDVMWTRLSEIWSTMQFLCNARRCVASLQSEAYAIRLSAVLRTGCRVIELSVIDFGSGFPAYCWCVCKSSMTIELQVRAKLVKEVERAVEARLLDIFISRQRPPVEVSMFFSWPPVQSPVQADCAPVEVSDLLIARHQYSKSDLIEI